MGSAWDAVDETFHLDNWDYQMLRKCLLRILFCSSWLGLFVAVAVTFAVLSTEKQRRGPVFVVQCISFPLAIVYNLQETIISYHRFVGTFAKPGQHVDFTNYVNVLAADLALEHFIPLIADLALLFKIRSFFPRPVYSYRRQMLMLAPLVALWIPRLGLGIANTYFIYKLESTVSLQPHRAYPAVVGVEWIRPTFITGQVEYGLGAVYSLYAACVLLYKARRFSKMHSSQLRRHVLQRRIRFFIEASLMSFIPPVGFSIAAICVMNVPSNKYAYYREMSGSIVNTSVLFGLLATSWSSIRLSNEQTSDGRDSRPNNFTPSALHGITMPTTVLSAIYEDETPATDGNLTVVKCLSSGTRSPSDPTYENEPKVSIQCLQASTGFSTTTASDRQVGEGNASQDTCIRSSCCPSTVFGSRSTNNRALAQGLAHHTML